MMCQEKIGPNCGSCLCKFEAGHKEPHENFHGTKWGKDNRSGWHRVYFNAYLDINAVSQEDAETSVQYALKNKQIIANGMADKVLKTGQVTRSEFLRGEDER